MTQQEIKKINIQDLRLWTENPRDPMDADLSDNDVIKRAVEDDSNKWNLPGIVLEMGDYYDFSELPTVVNVNGKFVVFDGNRRVAVLKYLQNKKLYSSFGGGLFPEIEPLELRSIKEIPCNICDKETALTNVERKHVNSGSWGPLEREYFLHIHRNQEKNLFLNFEEQTGAISKYPKMNQRFVKDEVLTEKNLKDIGFGFDQDMKIVTNYSDEKNKDIIEKIITLVEKGSLKTRGENRGKLKETLIKHYSDLGEDLNSFDESKDTELLRIEMEDSQNKAIIKRRTRMTESNNVIFGKALSLRHGKVNDLYRSISVIYEQSSKNESHLVASLPIVGMSLRLILDVAGREYFKDIGDEIVQTDPVYKPFLKVVKGNFKKLGQNEKINYLALSDLFSGNNNFEGILAKYAHGNIEFRKEDVLKNSIIVAEILELYFSKK